MKLYYLLLTLCLLAFVLLSLRSLLRAVLEPLRRLPGPLWSRFSRIWYLLNVWDGHFERTNIQLHRDLGPIVRIAPHQYSIDDPEAIKVIYGHGTKFTKSQWYTGAGLKGIHDIFTDTNPHRHADNRRKIASLYSMNSIVGFEPLAEECSKTFTTRMTEFARSGKAFDLQHWLQCCAFDLIGLITFDKRFGFLDKGEDIKGILETIHFQNTYMANVGVYAEWRETIRIIMQMLFPSTHGEGIVTFAQEEIAERMNSSNDKGDHSERHDFLTKALKMHHDDAEKFPMTAVFVACLMNVGAGSDTTSISLTAILYHLMRNPEKLKKLREELDEATSNGTASTPITFNQAQALPYLQACIKEALRLHPATGLPLVRDVPPGGATISGTFFPGGTTVGINTWVAHYNQTVFGPDPESFRPERWLDSKEKISHMDQYYFPFGLGSRTCIGKNISLLEISKVIPEVVRQFDFQLVHPERELETLNVWFVKQTNIECTVSLRQT